MKVKVTLNIGADNETGRIDSGYQNRVSEILKKHWPNGFTLMQGKGCWEGKMEDSLIAVIYLLNLIFKDLDDCIKELKVILKQDKIGVEVQADIDFQLK